MSEQSGGPGVLPTPHPTTWQVNMLQGEGGQVLLQVLVAHAAGVTVVFLDPVTAQRLGGQIRKAGKQAASGLVPVNTALLGPSGQPVSSGTLVDDDDEPDEQIPGQITVEEALGA